MMGSPSRFTHKTRLGRGSISRDLRDMIWQRDEYTCQFCGQKPGSNDLTIDHLIPLSLGGLDESTNYVTCCRSCNQLKGSLPLAKFARQINVNLEELPVHGDPLIDNVALPIQIRLLRKRIYDRIRYGTLHIGGSSAQAKLEKTYRLEFWKTPEGRALEVAFPRLPGQVRIMIPEIKTIAKNGREFRLLIELAKSANTRNLIGTVLTPDCDVESRLHSIWSKTKDEALKKRLQQAFERFKKQSVTSRF